MAKDEYMDHAEQRLRDKAGLLKILDEHAEPGPKEIRRRKAIKEHELPYWARYPS